MNYFIKYFKPKNYITGINRLRKRISVNNLSKKQFSNVEITPIWQVSNSNIGQNIFAEKYNHDYYYVFGKAINLSEINWHKDISSGYIYPLIPFDILKIDNHYNKGIDVLFVWVQSRFYFAVQFAQSYLESGDINFYLKFKNLTTDWIEKNPFLVGVNWLSPMEAAIRAINWITAVNLFGNIFEKDNEFKKNLSISLQQHAEYISAFPEIYENDHTTNHTTSDYAGLLFIALSLKDHPQSAKWLEQSLSGLINCMDSQVYEDGVDFEGSIPYHRLVLELFAYSTIVCLANNISLPLKYLSNLFKMFEYAAAYIDQSGNASSVGDDDSGRILVFKRFDECNFYEKNNNHRYLIGLGEHIFNHRFSTSAIFSNNKINKYLPYVSKLNLNDLQILPRITDQSISFEKGGAYFLKSSRIDFMLSCFPTGQNGRGGHNHLDTGSFTLSIDGEQIIVDPGTAVYSSDKKKRNKFRAYTYHNTLYDSFDEQYRFEDIGIWELPGTYNCTVNEFNYKMVDVSIETDRGIKGRKRKFEVSDYHLIINDSFNGEFISRINFHPDVVVLSTDKSGLITNKCDIQIIGNESFAIEEYEYAAYYQRTAIAKCLKVFAKGSVEIKIKPKDIL